MKGINLIKEIFKPFYDNMISVCENNHINKIKNLKNEFNDIMIGMSDPEFYPPNVNSFNTSLNKENEFESNNSLISLSKLDKNENTQEELISGFNDFVDDYINNNNGYIKSYNNTNNNVHIKKESFNISEMNKSKFNPNNNTILKNELMISNKNKFDLLENNFYSDDDIEEEEEKYLKNDGNEFSNNCNKFYYIISLITKGKNLSINKVNIKQLFLNNIKAKLNIKENNIFLSFDNSKKFIEVYIKTKEFASSSINIIKRDYPDFNKLFEYKMLYDHILNIDKRYLNYFDYNGNTISPNSSLNSLRGKEEYDPPYGWFGIGLNIDMYGDNKDWIENKTNKSKWAIAYHGVGQFLSNDQVKKKIVDIIILKDLIQTKKQKYSDSKDKRSTEKKKLEKVFI